MNCHAFRNGLPGYADNNAARAAQQQLKISSMPGALNALTLTQMRDKEVQLQWLQAGLGEGEM